MLKITRETEKRPKELTSEERVQQLQEELATTKSQIADLQIALAQVLGV